jgi:hypothetical protein
MKPPFFSRIKAYTKQLEDTVTPLEVAALMRHPLYSRLPFAIAPLLEQELPAAYLRSNFGKYVQLYSANCGARNLIIGFCGTLHRLMMPISQFLQLMPCEQHDVLVLSDVRTKHFDAGIEGYSSSFFETLKRLRGLIDERGYQSVICYGVSMGGYPALRAGIWLRAQRAVSVGGRFCEHPNRLLQRQHEIRAFDLMCACRPNREVPSLAVYASDNEDDVRNYEILNYVMPGCVEMRMETKSHNVIKHLDRTGQLSAFFAEIFALPGAAPAAPAPLTARIDFLEKVGPSV